MQQLKKYLWCVIVLVFLNFPQNNLAQSTSSTTANLIGQITDQSNAAINNVNIIIKNIDTSFTRETTSLDDGSYNVNQLPPGNYEIMVSAPGFKTSTTKVTLLLGTTTIGSFKLVLGESAEVVEIVASDIVDTTKTASSTNISKTQIDVLPINRRDFLDFALTSARVTVDRIPAQGTTATSGLSFNGQSPRFNSITIDGLDNNEVGTGAVRATFSQEAVQEFQILSDSYSAEFGRSLTGVVNIITKGGTNEFHGNLFFLNRNEAISARDAFATIKPDFSQYQFGTILSGPIKSDKLLFFNSFERLSLKQNNIVTISDLTVAAARRQGFLINNGPEPFSIGTTTFLTRVDAKINQNHNLYVRYNYGSTYNGNFEPFGGLNAQDHATAQRLEENTIALNDTYTVTNLNLINEFRFLYGRRDQKISQFDNGPEVNITAPEGLVSLGSFSSTQPRQERIYQVIDNISLSKKQHLLKFGVDFYYVNLPNKKTSFPFFDQGTTGFSDLDFSQLIGIPNLPTLTALEAFDPNLRTPAQLNFLTAASSALPGLVPGFPKNVPLASLALPFVYAQSFGDTSLTLPTKFFSTFIQDDIKLKSNLVIKAGLRYDINRVKFMPDNSGNFSPRIGFSYNPKKISNLNIRAFYGIFFATPLTGAAFISQLSKSNSLKILVVPFPFSILPYSLAGHRFPSSNNVPPNITFERQLSTELQLEPNVRNSYSHQVSFGFDYFLNNKTAVSVTYNFVRGIKLLTTRNINSVVRPAGNILDSLRTGRIDPTRGDVDEFETAYDSYFHGITLSVNRRLSNNFALLANYTFSKAIDDTFDLRTDVIDRPNNPQRPRDDRSLSVQDVRNRFILSGLWQLNYTKNPFLKDFQLSSIITVSSGRPYNLLVGSDINNDGGTDGDRPLIGNTPIGRNVGITPGFATVDLRLLRQTKIGEKFSILGFLEAFNLFNKVNINEINRIFPMTSQGFNLPAQENGRFITPASRYRSAFSPRQFQFGVKIIF
jgi:hypothetical protein